jgi:EmrB/QacA subfamily drug resistance transporter
MTAERPRVSPNVTLAVLLLAGTAYAMLSAAVIPALTTIQRDLHASETGVAWVLTAYLLTASAGTSILGRLGDMYGKERMLMWTLAILAVGTLLAAVSNSLALLIVARAIQGISGGIFPLAVGIVRDEFPREKVAGGIGLLSSTLGVGGGIGIVAGGIIVAHLSWHWLFWIPLVPVIAAAIFTWRFVPESPVRVPSRVNWLAALLMTGGLSLVLIVISETISWGWGSPKTLGLLAAGFAICGAWVWIEAHSSEPLIDMTMMRVRGVWTSNLAAFLIGGGMYSSFILYPQFAQLPKGIGFGASTVAAGLYLLPATVGMFAVSMLAGRVAARFGSKPALIVGTATTGSAFAFLAILHTHGYQMLISAALLGIGMGFAFAALGNLVVGAVPAQQTGVATGMNTVMRTLGGAIGAQIAATFVATNLTNGIPNVTGFTDSFLMATGLLVAALVASLFVPDLVAKALVARDVARVPGVVAFEPASERAPR